MQWTIRRSSTFVSGDVDDFPLSRWLLLVAETFSSLMFSLFSSNSDESLQVESKRSSTMPCIRDFWFNTRCSSTTVGICTRRSRGNQSNVESITIRSSSGAFHYSFRKIAYISFKQREESVSWENAKKIKEELKLVSTFSSSRQELLENRPEKTNPCWKLLNASILR